MTDTSKPAISKEGALIDLSPLKFDEAGINRVSAKLTEAILSEYARADFPIDVIVAGNIGKIIGRGGLAGFIVPTDIGLLAEAIKGRF